MRLAKKNEFFYGYIIVIVILVIQVIMTGTLYSFGVFFKPLLSEFGWSRVTASGAFSLYYVIMGLATIVVGRLNDKFGPRLILTACGFFLGLGYFLMSQISSIWQLYLFYGLIIGIGMSANFIPLVSVIARWFVERVGMMTGIFASGAGLGMVIMSPVASWFISRYAWRTSYIVIGVITLVFIIALAQFLRREPSELGLSPYGEGKVKSSLASRLRPSTSLQEAIHTSQFKLLCAIYFCYGFCLQTIMVHVVIHAIGLGISVTNAANILATIGGGTIAGRIMIGSSADRIGNKPFLIISFIVMSIALFWLTIASEVWMFYLFGIIFGFGHGGVMTLASLKVIELFGLSSHGAILGTILFAGTIGCGIGPVLAGMIFDVTSSYQLAFLICAFVSATGLILALLVETVAEGAL